MGLLLFLLTNLNLHIDLKDGTIYYKLKSCQDIRNTGMLSYKCSKNLQTRKSSFDTKSNKVGICKKKCDKFIKYIHTISGHVGISGTYKYTYKFFYSINIKESKRDV